MQNNLDDDSSAVSSNGAQYVNEKINAPLDNAKIVRLIIYDDAFSAEFSSDSRRCIEGRKSSRTSLIGRITSENKNICVKHHINVISDRYIDNVFLNIS